MRTSRMWWRCTRRGVPEVRGKNLNQRVHTGTRGKLPIEFAGAKRLAGEGPGEAPVPPPHELPRGCRLELVPKVLVVYVVVVLHLGRFYERAEQAGPAIGRCLLHVGVAALHVLPQQLRGPICLAEGVGRPVEII